MLKVAQTAAKKLTYLTHRNCSWDYFFKLLARLANILIQNCLDFVKNQ